MELKHKTQEEDQQQTSEETEQVKEETEENTNGRQMDVEDFDTAEGEEVGELSLTLQVM